jgi:putative peptidoglycan lipid II flippase
MRLIMLLLIPCAAATIALATPITRLVYQHGDFGEDATRQVSEALLWFSFSLPFNGANLLLTRTFFSLQRPWIPTALACTSMVVNLAVSLALYKPLGIAGIVIGTAVSNAVMMLQQAYYLRRELHGFEVIRTLRAMTLMTIAGAAFGGAAYGVWRLLDDLAGRSLAGQIVSVGGGLLAGLVVYVGIVLAAKVPEAQTAARLVRQRLS